MSSDRRLSEQAPTVNTNGRAYIKGRQLMVHGKPFLVQGICYSPVPVNESVYWKPTGDYFTNEYSFIWLRDLPLIKAMGANVVRTYGWDPNKDHSDFLDAVHANGLYLMTTFYIGDASESPVSTQAQRDALISKFTLQVSQYKSHPALMIWSFGNEMNGVWNGFLQQLGKSEVDPCGWDERYDDLGGCWVHKGKAPEPDSPCYASTQCVYSRMFKFLDQAAAAAHAEADVIVVSTFADVDALYDKVNRTGGYAPNLDAWSAQVYRGNTFGDFFEGISNVSAKPILLTEYGVDAYHDVCGKDETTTPCFNTLDNPMGSYEDEESQAAYAVNLTREIQWRAGWLREGRPVLLGQRPTCPPGGSEGSGRSSAAPSAALAVWGLATASVAGTEDAGSATRNRQALVGAARVRWRRRRRRRLLGDRRLPDVVGGRVLEGLEDAGVVQADLRQPQVLAQDVPPPVESAPPGGRIGPAPRGAP